MVCIDDLRRGERVIADIEDALGIEGHRLRVWLRLTGARQATHIAGAEAGDR